jgi:hypothetical protein
VTEALLSISGYYTTVYGYDVTDDTDPWKVYDVTVPEWVNDLHELEFGQGYWINVSEAITLFLKGSSDSIFQRVHWVVQAIVSHLQSPPATYYGWVLPSPDFTPLPGMVVTAWIDSNLCGQSQTLEVDGRVAYSVNVSADGPGDAVGCGAPERRVTFKIGRQVMVLVTQWDNSRVWRLPLSSGFRVYLPLTIKEQ